MHSSRLFALFTLLILASCASKPEVNFKNYEGEIFGTYYRVQVGDASQDYQAKFDSVFALINTAANSYVQESEVSDFNATGSLDRKSVV
jgi:thiamine biosynthesis lipoprotein